MTEEMIKKVLTDYGLTEKEAEVYIFLAKHSALKSGEIAKLMKKDKAQIFRVLKVLQTKGLVESTLEFPTRFVVVSFESVLESSIKAKRDEAALIENAKKDLLSYLKNNRQETLESSLEKFVIIEGNKRTYQKIIKMAENTKYQFSATTTIPTLLRSKKFGFYDEEFVASLNSNIEFRFLSELSDENLAIMKTVLSRTLRAGVNLKVRNPELSVKAFPQMVIKDDEEAMFVITPTSGASPMQPEVCLWTNCKPLVQAFTAVFEDLWRNSDDIGKKMAEIKEGQSIPKTCIIADEKAAEKKYNETLQLAKEDIIIVTSVNGLNEFLKKKLLIEKWAENRMVVKIMAPITLENNEAAKQLSKLFSIRHVPEFCSDTTVVDGRHLFQFTASDPQKDELDSVIPFENTFYTNDVEYVEKTKNALTHVWRGACTISTTPLESVIGPIPKNDPLILSVKTNPEIRITPIGHLTEKDVLDKILSAKTFQANDPPKVILRLYSSRASAMIHPPENFGLPEMMIELEHTEKASSFGGRDTLAVYLWMDSLHGRSLLPVAVAGGGQGLMFNVLLEHIAKEYGVQTSRFQALKEDELQIRIHGHSLFAVWSVPIMILPQKYTLPPACLMVEGYGDVKTVGYAVDIPRHAKYEIEKNYFDAFVTLMHPSSMYSGPGTDGLFVRDYIQTTTCCPRLSLEESHHKPPV